MNTQFLFYLLLALILGLVYVVLFMWNKLSQQNRVIKRPQEDYKDSLEIIEDAQKQASTIVEKAVESAKHILFETEYIKQDITKDMQDSLQRVAEETIKMVQGRSTESDREFRTVVDEIKAEFSKQAASKLAAIEKIALQETEDFKEILRRETVGSQMFIGKKISQDFQEVQKEIEEYKNTKMLEAEKNINMIIKQVVLDALGASITLPIHEDLVLASLENAKKVGMFRGLEQQGEKQESGIKKQAV